MVKGNHRRVRQDNLRRAVFLDRDGVLVRDIGCHSCPKNLEVLPDVPEALSTLAAAGYDLIVVSNQAAVARGLAIESDIEALASGSSRALARLVLEELYLL